MKRYITQIIIGIVLVIFTGCGGETQLFIAKPVGMNPAPDKSRITLQRVSKSEGSVVPMVIYNNHQKIGTLKNGESLTWDTNAGENIFASGYRFDIKEYHPVTFYLRGGDTYVFEIALTGELRHKFIPVKGLIMNKTQYNEQQNAILEAKQKELENKQQNEVNSYIAQNNFQGLKDYTEQNPNAVYYIEDESLRLALTGPKGMKVGDVRKLLKEGRSEKIIISLIKRVKTPYKEFTLDEIDLLSKMGLSENIIAEMIDVTTLLLRDEKLKEQQTFFLAEQKRVANQKTQVIYQNNSSASTNQQNNPLVDKVQDELIKQGAKMIWDRLF